ncbi:MAG: DNA mismatch repair protein MutS, partial [Halobacteria archaeon]|nr:DNA mismatch repair protein MutS [Halobacteria archaeon]
SCSNVHLDAVEHDDSIVFMHHVKPGPASRSYGLQVAALAGVPRDMIELAKDKLVQLEQGKTEVPASPVVASSLSPSAVEMSLAEIDPDNLSPKEALECLYRLKELTGKKNR